jgi:hypothetical protein
MTSSLVQADFTFTKYISTIAKVKAPFKLSNLQLVLSDSSKNQSDYEKFARQGIVFGNATNYSRSDFLISCLSLLIFLLACLLLEPLRWKDRMSAMLNLSKMKSLLYIKSILSCSI